jgi:hypothetical protein
VKRQHSRKYWHKTALIGSKGVPQTFFFAQMGSADIFHHQKGFAHRKRLVNTALDHDYLSYGIVSLVLFHSFNMCTGGSLTVIMDNGINLLVE